MKKEMRLNIMIILIVICLAMLTACMKGAPDDAYMIDLTDERNVVINDSIVFWADGDIEKNKLLEQFIFEEFNDCFNTNIPNVGKIEHGDKEKAIKAAEYFLKEYFGTRYIDAGNGKAKVNFKKDTGRGKLCYYRCGDVFVLFETDEGSFRGCFDLRIQTYLHCKDESAPWTFTINLNLYEQSAKHLCMLYDLNLMSVKKYTFDRVSDSQTAFAAAKKMSRWARCQEKEYKVYFSPYSNAWFVCAKHWIIAFGEDNTILYSAIVI